MVQGELGDVPEHLGPVETSSKILEAEPGSWVANYDIAVNCDTV